MFDAVSALHYCQRCGSPLEPDAHNDSIPLSDCPRCRRVVLAARRDTAVEESEILDWLLAADSDPTPQTTPTPLAGRHEVPSYSH